MYCTSGDNFPILSPHYLPFGLLYCVWFCYTVTRIVVRRHCLMFPCLNKYWIEFRRQKGRDSRLGVTWIDPVFRKYSVTAPPCVLSQYNTKRQSFLENIVNKLPTVMQQECSITGIFAKGQELTDCSLPCIFAKGQELTDCSLPCIFSKGHEVTDC